MNAKAIRALTPFGYFKFSLDDVAFGICAESDVLAFEKMTDDRVPFVDPTRQSLDALKAKLRRKYGLENLR